MTQNAETAKNEERKKKRKKEKKKKWRCSSGHARPGRAKPRLPRDPGRCAT